jgi:hypothetical protein
MRVSAPQPASTNPNQKWLGDIHVETDRDNSGVGRGHPFSALSTASITHVIPIAPRTGPELHH